MNEWIDREKEKPKDGEQVLVDLQGTTRADDAFMVTRYIAEKDLFACESYTKKVVRWARITNPGRRVRVNWVKWSEEFGKRA